MAAKARYPRFRRIDGTHPWKRRVAGGFVDYHARRRRDGQVAFFNFALAKEMGLIPASAPRAAEPGALARDPRHLRPADPERVGLPAPHARARARPPAEHLHGHALPAAPAPGPARHDLGRRAQRVERDHHTRRCHLGPVELRRRRDAAVPRDRASEGRFFRTGSRTASLRLRHRGARRGHLRRAPLRDVPPQRHRDRARAGGDRAVQRPRDQRARRPEPAAPLALLRAAQAGRPAAAARGDRRVRRAPDRRTATGRSSRPAPRATATWPTPRRTSFARAAATFESEYVFCWLDWDGDNVLADGGIIDYGSVRQFGLYHREYRFDDSDRWSTTIPEQRTKARDIVQGFAQIRAFLLEGMKRPLAEFAHDPCAARFDREFAATKERLLLRKLGLRPATGALRGAQLRARARALQARVRLLRARALRARHAEGARRAHLERGVQRARPAARAARARARRGTRDPRRARSSRSRSRATRAAPTAAPRRRACARPAACSAPISR